MLQLKNVKKDFYIENKKIEVLKGISLELKQGERVALTGKSGAGKSTLLNIIATLEKPDSGEIMINNENPVKMKDSRLSLFRNREIGVVFQFHHLLPEFTALENVAMPLLIGRAKKEAFIKAEEFLNKVGLAGRLNHKPAELSGGEQQRVAVARAICTSPNLLLMDEPTGNLDNETGNMILDMIISLAEEKNLTTVFVTHNENFAERMNRIYNLKQGRICES